MAEEAASDDKKGRGDMSFYGGKTDFKLNKTVHWKLFTPRDFDSIERNIS